MFSLSWYKFFKSSFEKFINFYVFLGEFNIVWDTHLQNESIVGTRMILGWFSGHTNVKKFCWVSYFREVQNQEERAQTQDQQ